MTLPSRRINIINKPFPTEPFTTKSATPFKASEPALIAFYRSLTAAYMNAPEYFVIAMEQFSNHNVRDSAIKITSSKHMSNAFSIRVPLFSSSIMLIPASAQT